MSTLSIQNIVLDEIALRILVSITTGIFWLGLIIILLSLFRIKNPSIRYIFLTIPLIKSLLALARNMPSFKPFNGFFLFFARFPDPGHLAPVLSLERADAFYGKIIQPTASLSAAALIIVIGAVVGFSIWRMFGLIRFLRLMRLSSDLSRTKHRAFYEILDRLVEDAGIRHPRVVELDSSGTPFTVGTTKPIIAVSSKMLGELDPPEIEAALAHEIAHITRRDHLYHLPIVIMRDILYFNPVSHFLYPRISFERERACDQIVSRVSKPLVLAKSLVKIAEIHKTQPASALIGLYAPQNLVGQSSSNLVRRVRELIEPTHAFKSLTKIKKSLLIFSVLFLLIVDVHVIAQFSDHLLILS